MKTKTPWLIALSFLPLATLAAPPAEGPEWHSLFNGKELSYGHIALQAESQPTGFRNIRIKQLDP